MLSGPFVVARSAHGGDSRMASSLCNVCGGSLEPRFGRVLDPQTGEVFAIHGCVKCGLGHTLPQPEDLGRYYGTTYHGGRHGFTAAYCASRRVRIVGSVTSSAPNGSVAERKLLDVGCGDGTFISAARTKGWTVFGTEMNPEIARGAGLEVWETIEQAKTSGPFDCITLWHSLEHLRDPRSTLTQLSKLLSPAGVLVIAVPDAGGLQARFFGAKWFHLDVPRHLYHFNELSLARLVASAGLTITRRWHQEFEYDLFGWSQSALNSLSSVPNVFFYSLTGRPTHADTVAEMVNVGLGLVLSGLSVPAVALGTLSHNGGTLVIAARRETR